jgi:xanthine dehydrogenase YagT iron-sulfur-binding subunit
VAAAATLQTSATTFAQEATGAGVVAGETTVELSVNGSKHKVKVEPRTTLLDVLRYQLDLTGAKPICTDGSSGGATVLIDGKPMQANIMLALQAVGKEISTVESLSPDGVPAAFTACDAQQCGFCTPGFVVAVKAFLDKKPKATEAEIRAGLNGNLCRCGTYVNVVQAAVRLVKGSA